MAEHDIACAINEGRMNAEVVLRTPEVIAFLDHRPVFKGHVLVVPRLHVETLVDLPAQMIAPFFSVVQRLASALPSALIADGTFVAVNNVVSQSVPHLHAHVVPRRRKDGLRGFFWPRVRYADALELEATAAAIRGQLAID